jgi:hypothetical protein
MADALDRLAPAEPPDAASAIESSVHAINRAEADEVDADVGAFESAEPAEDN